MKGVVCIILFFLIQGLLVWIEIAILKRLNPIYKETNYIGYPTALPLLAISIILAFLILSLLGC